MALLASMPIVLILLLMLVLRWPAARAGVAGVIAAALLAPAAFGFGDGQAASLAFGYAGVASEGAFTTATILWILWPALALHQHQQDSGAIRHLQAGLSHVSPSPSLQVLLVAWFMALFLEGAAGFGTPVALAAPILVSLGLPPVQAVVAALLGHAVGVSFGALGTPVLAQVALTTLDGHAIGWRTAVLHAVSGGVMMVFLHRVLSSAGGANRPAPAWSMLAAGAFLLPSLALALMAGPELATLGAALVGGSIFAILARAGRRSTTGIAEGGQLIRAFWPYAVLVVLVLLTRAVPPIASTLAATTLEWRWLDTYGGRFSPLTHPGTLLFGALLIGARLQGLPPAQLRSALTQAARRLVPVSVALLAMLCLSRLMVHAGMIDAIQAAAVRAVGDAWPLVAPAVGALGSFVTGSATASNVLFTSLLLLVAAQGFGAAVGNIVCPHNIIAGAATVGLAGREAEILRRTLLPCVAYLLLGGVTVAAWVAVAAPAG